jgi:histidine triad (HIT) family protein
MAQNCPFCNVASGKAAASIVYETENVLAFMDLNPISVGHTLVVSRQHFENIYEVPETLLAELTSVVKRVCVAVKKAVAADGIKVIQLNGRAAGQVVFHIHFHVIPAHSDAVAAAGAGRHGRVMSSRKDLDATAKKIRENL